MMKEFVLLNYLNEDQKSFEVWCHIKHKSSILCEPLNIAFVPSVHKDWRSILGATPMPIIKQISLLESCITLWLVVEMVQVLREVPDLIGNFTGGWFFQRFMPSKTRRESRDGCGRERRMVER